MARGDDDDDGTRRGSKRQRRHVRSRNGCITCRQRKVKCDEAKPACQRCGIEDRQCMGYETSHDGQPILQPSLASSVADGSRSSVAAPLAGTDRPSLTPGLADGSQTAITPNLAARSSVSITSPPQPQLANQAVLDNLLSSLWGEGMNTGGDNGEWLADGLEWMVSRHCTPPVPMPPSPLPYQGSPAAIAAAVPGPSMPAQHALLQSQLEAACSSPAQLAGVSQFFNHVAQCFHLIPVEANRWRSVFGRLCLQSDIILRLVTAIGMVSLSYCGAVNYRPAAYAHVTYALNAWKQLVRQSQAGGGGDGGGNRDAITLTALQVLAVPILVGHVEQFDVGVERETNACMAVAKETVVALIGQGDTSLVDMGSSSAFRFLTRILLWWDTFSGTMGTGAGGPDAAVIFDTVRAWEQQDDGETALDSTQCVTSWPLDLLEAVARTTKLAKELRAGERGQWLSFDQSLRSASVNVTSSAAHDGATMDRILSEARGIEMQIRSCRPHIVLQDSARASELRYIVFEIMQAGALIYFSRVLCGDTVHVAKEVERVVQFFIRSDVAAKERAAAAAGPPGKPTEWRHAWAADVAVIWSTMQAVIAVKPSRQDACRRVMRGLREQGDCGALDVWIELIEEVWLQRRRLATAEVDEGQHLSGICDAVMAQRRWKQLFVF